MASLKISLCAVFLLYGCFVVVFLLFFFVFCFYIKLALFCILIACPDGRYGINCQEQCNVNCGVSYRCDRVTGQCEGGCQVGWKGETCDTSKGSFFHLICVNQLNFTKSTKTCKNYILKCNIS